MNGRPHVPHVGGHDPSSVHPCAGGGSLLARASWQQGQFGAEGSLDSQQSGQARVPQAALDLGVCRPVYAGPLGEFLLGQTRSVAGGS